MSTDSRDLATNSHSPAESTAVTSPGAGEPPVPSRPPKAGGGPARPRWLDWRILSVLALAVIAVPVWRLMNNAAKARTLETAAGGGQPVAVAVTRASREDLYNEVPMPAEFRPYMEVELHAKVSGYVDQMYVDIGDRVKAGQLLATLEVPELRDEHARALAAEKRAVADYKDAHLVYQRLLAVEKDHPNLVAQQELDAAEAKDSTTEAAIAGAKAERQKDETLLAYTKITAPFDGVITHRYADPGSLIQAGTSSDTQSMPLVRLSENYHLRLDFPVSVAYVKDIHLGDRVDVRVESLGNKTFTGIISRDTGQVDDETRTLRTEIEVENPKLELVPGMYAEALLKVQRHPQALSVPIEAISFEKEPSVYLVNQAQEIEERPVRLGLETPTRCEILDGLKEGDLVMTSPRSKVRLGEKVEPKLRGSLAQK
jgi:RND family efflux transporter MFP subunit